MSTVQSAPGYGERGLRPVIKAMRDGDPSVAVAGGGGSSIHLNPMAIREGEREIVLERLKEEIDRARSS